jgi:hypothetical protein
MALCIDLKYWAGTAWTIALARARGARSGRWLIDEQ